ncbi:MAG: type I-E CRISPR-associated protein Cse2/CasB [Firmicutes bacterium]|nr:type I-E CRISPR-associated protein Cse2/CasB [Bacillota bacterium]
MGKQKNDTYLIRRFTRRKIDLLLEENSWSRGMLAKLRRGIGKKPGELPELYEIFLEGMPERLYGRGSEPSYSEWAIYTALTLFALHQQGKSRDRPMSIGWSPESEDEGNSLGRATGLLVSRSKDREPAIKRRFDAVVTAIEFTEFAYHARGMIQLLKREDIPLDYPRLAEDLFWYQFEEHRNRVRLRWGEDYYRASQQNAEIDSEEEQNEKP